MRTVRRSCEITLMLLCGLVLRNGVVAFGQEPDTDTHRSRFDPPFRNEVHAPRTEDAAIVQILRIADGRPPGKARLLLAKGHFLDGGNETVVATALWRVSGGDSLATFLFSKDASGWKLRSHDYALNAAYCRVLPVTAGKDVLLCQTNDAGLMGRYGKGRSGYAPVHDRLQPRACRLPLSQDQGYRHYRLSMPPMGQPEISRVEKWIVACSRRLRSRSIVFGWQNTRRVQESRDAVSREPFWISAPAI
jgi:hypothetical protein